MSDTVPTEPITPESYLGFQRLDPARYVGTPVAGDRLKAYAGAKKIPRDSLAYSGSWRVEAERIVAGPKAALSLHYHARDVYLVLGGPGVGHRLVPRAAGKDGSGRRLQALHAAQLRHDRRRAARLTFTPGVQAYAFTFG